MLEQCRQVAKLAAVLEAVASTYLTTSQEMSSTVSSLVVVDITARFSGVEAKSDMKDDTASCCWVEMAVALKVSC